MPRTASDLSTMSEGGVSAGTMGTDGPAAVSMDPGVSPVQINGEGQAAASGHDGKRAHGSSGSKTKGRHKRHGHADTHGGGTGSQAAAAASRKRLNALRERLHEALWSALPTYAPVFNSIPPL